MGYDGGLLEPYDSLVSAKWRVSYSKKTMHCQNTAFVLHEKVSRKGSPYEKFGFKWTMPKWRGGLIACQDGLWHRKFTFFHFLKKIKIKFKFHLSENVKFQRPNKAERPVSFHRCPTPTVIWQNCSNKLIKKCHKVPIWARGRGSNGFLGDAHLNPDF